MTESHSVVAPQVSDLTRFVRFLATGGTSAVLTFASRFVFDVVVPYWLAILLAYLLGMTTAFLLAKRFVFTSSNRSTTGSAFWFTVVNIFAAGLTLAVSLTLARIVFPAVNFEFHPEAVAHAVGIMSPVFTSYLGHKHLSFRAGP
jgi:putative flippase GtrA